MFKDNTKKHALQYEKVNENAEFLDSIEKVNKSFEGLCEIIKDKNNENIFLQITCAYNDIIQHLIQQNNEKKEIYSMIEIKTGE